jgi:hypothetical protein
MPHMGRPNGGFRAAPSAALASNYLPVACLNVSDGLEVDARRIDHERLLSDKNTLPEHAAKSGGFGAKSRQGVSRPRSSEAIQEDPGNEAYRAAL